MFYRLFQVLFSLSCIYFIVPLDLFAQESAPGIIITCPSPHQEDAHSYIPPIPPKNISGTFRTTQTATFIVEYIGFTESARNAFQHAIDIWQTRIHSSVPIRVRATWKSLESGVLGSAGATTIYRNFDGAPNLNTWYPVALAEKLARKELNEPDLPDIVADFNSDANWYLKTDGNPLSGTTDFVTVVLHEIAHGLGFVASTNVEDNQGSWGTSNFPLSYDHYIENNSGQRLTNTSIFPNPSTELATQLSSNSVFFEGSIVAERHSQRPKLFAPSPYDIGSSISHLDENAYPPGHINSLMTPRIATAEAIHDPGPMVINMLAELGWESTFIDVSANKDLEDAFSPVILKAAIFTENNIIPESLILHYSTNNFITSSQVLMQPSQNPNEYEVSISAPLIPTTISYYIEVTDNFDRDFTTPINAPNGFHQINIGPDLFPPVINHDPLEFIFVNDLSVVVSVVATDNVGINDITVEYSINNVSQPSFTLTHAGNDEYVGNFIFQPGQLSPGDEIQYRIIARDISQNTNTTFRPSQGNYKVPVRDIFQPRESYVNDFSQPTDDFLGNGFRIISPSEFNSPAIHSDHPYGDGTGITNQNNFIFQLLVPIIVEPMEAIMRWSEIVLVEPGEQGSEFGDSDFYDYVIIEGSNNDGQTWIPLLPGYDSRKNSVWLNHYNSMTEDDNSEAEGNPSLYRRDSLDLLDTFSPGDIILIRFRFFADESAYGWGWAIDELNIQGEPRKLRDELVLRPNPSEGVFFLEIPIKENTKQLEIRIFNTKGQEVFYQNHLNPNSSFIKEIDLRNLIPGVYIVRLQSENIITSRRLLLR